MTFAVPRHDIKPKKGEENGAQENVAASHHLSLFKLISNLCNIILINYLSHVNYFLKCCSKASINAHKPMIILSTVFNWSK